MIQPRFQACSFYNINNEIKKFAVKYFDLLEARTVTHSVTSSANQRELIAKKF